jgi:hypothetical protein
VLAAFGAIAVVLAFSVAAGVISASIGPGIALIAGCALATIVVARVGGFALGTFRRGACIAVARSALGAITITAATVATTTTTALLATSVISIIALGALATSTCRAFARFALVRTVALGAVVAGLAAGHWGRRAEDRNVEDMTRDRHELGSEHLEAIGHHGCDFLVRSAELLEQCSRLDAAECGGIGHRHGLRQQRRIATTATLPAATAATVVAVAAFAALVLVTVVLIAVVIA